MFSVFAVRDEHHLGQVEIDLEVVIVEGGFCSGSSTSSSAEDGSPRKSMRHLVDFVEQEQRIVHAGLGHVLHDLAGHRADVGPAMAADLGLVAHAAKGHAHELAVGRRAMGGRARSCRRPADRPAIRRRSTCRNEIVPAPRCVERIAVHRFERRLRRVHAEPDVANLPFLLRRLHRLNRPARPQHLVQVRHLGQRVELVEIHVIRL